MSSSILPAISVELTHSEHTPGLALHRNQRIPLTRDGGHSSDQSVQLQLRSIQARWPLRCSVAPSHAHGKAVTVSAIGYQAGPRSSGIVARAPAAAMTVPIAPATRA